MYGYVYLNVSFLEMLLVLTNHLVCGDKYEHLKADYQTDMCYNFSLF